MNRHTTYFEKGALNFVELFQVNAHVCKLHVSVYNDRDKFEYNKAELFFMTPNGWSLLYSISPFDNAFRKVGRDHPMDRISIVPERVAAECRTELRTIADFILTPQPPL